MSTSDFFKWKRYLEIERSRPSRSDYYLMSIAREVRCVLMRSSERKEQKLDDFIIKFEKKGVKKKLPVAKALPEPTGIELDEDEMLDSHEDVPQEVKERVIASKARWFGFLGIKEEPRYGS